uniref:Reverse transcriptase domain-containing protein n=1 Tax=Anolis carolinensis TaxID=28377 RepID=A0A803T6B3_ANOCA
MTTGITGQHGSGQQNEAGRRLIEFHQENSLCTTNTLFQQPKRLLYTWTSPDDQHRNQIDYIFCSQRWRTSIQSVKTRPGADCSSDYELLIAKFRIKLKRMGKIHRPIRYDVTNIPSEYAVEVKNRFQGLDLINRIPEELWTEVHNIVQEAATKYDTILTAVSEDVTSAPACPVLLDSFQLVELEDADKILGKARPTTCILDPCPSWLVREARGGLAEWVKVVVNASLREGKFPASLKMAVIKPLLKKPSLDPTQFGNFRPISNLPYLGKVLEHVVASQLQGFLVDTDFLDPAQSGFRPGHGTETALVALVDYLRRELDRGSVSLLVLLDLSAAFDTVDHGILLGRLAGMGLGGTVLQWLHSFLEGRSQMVSLGDACSAPQPLTCEVPQGSVLSPMLFNIYMKPLGEIIRSFGVRCHLYADDVQLCHSFPLVTKEAVQVLNRCLAAVLDWMRVSGPRLQGTNNHTQRPESI